MEDEALLHDDVFDRDANGAMTLAGHEVHVLVERYGSPLTVILEPLVRASCRAYREALAGHYPRARVHYAAKAFLTTGFARLIAEEDLGLDVVSEGELATSRLPYNPRS